MKKILIALLCFASCTNSTEVGKMQYSTGNPLETIIDLPAGRQAAPNVSGKSWIRYTASKGQVIFTTKIQGGNAIHITFDGRSCPGNKFGFTSEATDYVYDPGVTNNQYPSFLNFDFGKTAAAIFKGDPTDWKAPVRQKYAGTPETALYWGIFVDTFQVGGKTGGYIGTPSVCSNYENVCIGISLHHGVINADSTSPSIFVQGHSIYGQSYEDIDAFGPTATNGDSGFFYTSGSGHALRCRSFGRYGYIWRDIVCVLGGNIPFDQSNYIRSCLKVNGTAYGFIDIRNQTNELSSNGIYPITGGDFIVASCTSGHNRNRTDTGYQYITNMVVVGSMKDDLGTNHRIKIDSCFGFDAKVTGNGGENNSSLFKDNSNGERVLDTANNIDLKPGVPIPSGLVDAEYYALPGSVLDKNKVGIQKPTVILPPVNPCPPVYVHDTTIVNIHDTTIKTVHDTTIKTVHDTVAAKVVKTVVYFQDGTTQ